MAVSDKITSNLIEELIDAGLPGSALPVYLTLYRLSVLQRRKATEPITVLKIAEEIGRGDSVVTDAIKYLRGRNLRKRKWLKVVRPSNRSCQYEVMTPKLGSVWDASRNRPPAVGVEKKTLVRVGRRMLYVRSNKADSN